MANGPDTTRAQDDWQALSQQYWNAWTDATRNVFGAAANTTTADKMPWHEGLEQWSRMFDAGKTHGAQNEIVERLLAGARSYFACCNRWPKRARRARPIRRHGPMRCGSRSISRAPMPRSSTIPLPARCANWRGRAPGASSR